MLHLHGWHLLHLSFSSDFGSPEHRYPKAPTGWCLAFGYPSGWLLSQPIGKGWTTNILVKRHHDCKPQRISIRMKMIGKCMFTVHSNGQSPPPMNIWS